MDVNGVLALDCPTCGATALPGDRFCEQCGERLGDGAPPPATERCQACGAAGTIDAEGYCTRCGMRERVADRQEIDVAIAAGVSDRGRVRTENQDALHLEAVDGGIAAVVADGISSSGRAAEAARSATETAVGLLTAALSHDDLPGAVATAIRAAHDAVAELSAAGTDPPGCTIVVALSSEHGLAVGWVGDSRAYWVSGRDARKLTTDHSWAAEQVARGLLTAAEAAADPSAHAVTRWLGTGAPDEPPSVLSVEAGDGGRLVLCTDGLWNYLPEATDLVRLAGGHPEPLDAARALVDHALAAGGRDNVTVAVLDIPPARSATA
jgi:serine/threonine protein phosphatase PrpC